MNRRLPFVSAALALCIGCSANSISRECASSAECVQGGIAGVCVDSPVSDKRWCAFTDLACSVTNLRWGVTAGDGFEGMCVPPAVISDAGPPDASLPFDARPDAALPSRILSVANSGGGTVTSAPVGIDCGADCVESFADSTSVTLTATALAGKEFVGWSGACAAFGATPTCTLLMTSDRIVTSTFAPPGSVLSLTTFGGTGFDQVTDVAVDASGNLFVVGEFVGMMTIGGTMLLGLAGLESIFVAKFDPSGTLVWAKAFGSSGANEVSDVAIDPASGDAWLLGYFTSPINFGGGTLTSAGAWDVFVAKLAAADGSHLFSQRFGGAANESPGGLDVDASGSVVLGGTFSGTVNFGGTDLTALGPGDVFFLKLGSAGAYQWSERFGGPSPSTLGGLTLDSAGNPILTGRFAGTVDFGGGGATAVGSTDIYVAKYSSTGAYLWADTVGGPGLDESDAVVADSASNVLVTGTFSGSVNFGGGALTASGSSDIFVAKFASTGAYSWASKFGGSSTEGGAGIAVDGSDNVVVTGYFSSPSIDFGLGLLTNAGQDDVFGLSLSTTGVPRWADRFGGGSSDEGLAIAVDPSTSDPIIVGGFTGTASFGGMAAGSV